MNTPKCKICGDQHQLDQFDSSAWIQGTDNRDCINNPEGEAKTIWICPECSEIIGCSKELYPDLKGDLLIGLWKRIHGFAQNRARERRAQLHFVKLEETFPHDYGWQATVEMNAGSIEKQDIIKYKGWGIEAHEAMLGLFHKVKEDLPEE